MSDRSSWLSYADAPKIVHPPPGPRSKELLESQSQMETEAIAYPRSLPIAIREARGSTVEDMDGNRYIDWMSGISVLNLGHRHPRLVQALRSQSEKIWHSLEFPTEARIDFLRELRDVLPGSLRNHAKVFLSVTGGDAIETAVNIADHAKGHRGTITFSGAYHGVHGGAVNLTAGRRYRATSSFRGGGSILRVPFPDPYHPLLDPEGGSQGLVRYLTHLITDPHSGADEISSILVEPILGEGGYVVPPDDFLPSLRELCDEHDLLLIFDEVQSGLGRTGKMWACEHWKVTPDILCSAKSIGGGIPLAVVAYRDDLGRELPPGFHLGTYRGNPLGMAVGAETLRVLRDEDWIATTARRGGTVLKRFASIARDHASIGDVRGKGFMIGIELVQDPATRKPATDAARALKRELLNRGVLMHTCGSHDQVMRFMSPLVIEDELLERGLDTFEQAIEALDPSVAPPTASPRRAKPIPGPRPPPMPGLSPPPHPAPAPPPPGRTLP
jgi:4-aminobutyrate aminotransferase-like enzyme